MSRPVAVLRPEPGNAATVARVRARGWTALSLPLFIVRPLRWTPPSPQDFDTLLLTSANAVRHAGPGLLALAGLPVAAVGEATAAAARAAGLRVVLVGTGDAATLVTQAGGGRLLHLGGRENRVPDGIASVPVYASEPVDVATEELGGAVALLHSPRAAARLRVCVPASLRPTMALAALSRAVVEAAGGGWERLLTAPAPTDAALLDTAAVLLR